MGVVRELRRFLQLVALEARVDAIDKKVLLLNKRANDLMDENARLRKALERIRDMKSPLVDAYQNVACAALEGKEQG